MLIERFHIEFQVFLDKRSTSQVPEIPSELVDLYLNEAQERFIKTRYGGNNLYRTSAEETQKRIDDLRVLIKTVEITPTLDNLQESYDIVLPSDYMFLARVRARSVSQGCANWVDRVKITQHDDLEVVKKDPFNKPSNTEAVAYFEGNLLKLATVTGLVYNLSQLTYFKRPVLMNLGTYGELKQECELPDHTHKEIIQMAVDIAIENIESQRGQTIKQQLNSIE